MGGAVFVIKALLETSGLTSRGERAWAKQNCTAATKQTKSKKRRVVFTAGCYPTRWMVKESFLFLGAQVASLLRPLAFRPKCSECFRQAAENGRLAACHSPELRSHRQDSHRAERHSGAPAQFSRRTPGRNRSASANLP